MHLNKDLTAEEISILVNTLLTKKKSSVKREKLSWQQTSSSSRNVSRVKIFLKICCSLLTHRNRTQNQGIHAMSSKTCLQITTQHAQ